MTPFQKITTRIAVDAMVTQGVTMAGVVAELDHLDPNEVISIYHQSVSAKRMLTETAV